MTHWRHPFGLDTRGRTASADADRHVRDLIEQVLFTSPGERVRRADFGCGLNTLLFGPNSPEIVAATRHTVQGALQRFLSDRIRVDDVLVEHEDSRLEITVRYTRLVDQLQLSETFVRETAG
jgi:phage baseplate assembly protein W